MHLPITTIHRLAFRFVMEECTLMGLMHTTHIHMEGLLTGLPIIHLPEHTPAAQLLMDPMDRHLSVRRTIPTLAQRPAVVQYLLLMVHVVQHRLTTRTQAHLLQPDRARAPMVRQALQFIIMVTARQRKRLMPPTIMVRRLPVHGIQMEGKPLPGLAQTAVEG